MNLFKVMQAQAKARNSTWLTAHGGGSGCMQLQGAKKRLFEGKELNALVTNAVKKFIKSNNRVNFKAEYDSDLE